MNLDKSLYNDNGDHIRVLVAELTCMAPVRCTDASPVFIIALTTTYWYDN